MAVAQTRVRVYIDEAQERARDEVRKKWIETHNEQMDDERLDSMIYKAGLFRSLVILNGELDKKKERNGKANTTSI